MGDVSGTIKELVEQEWPKRLATAGEQLKVVCTAAAILPLPLLKLVLSQVDNMDSLISQYELKLDAMLSSQKIQEHFPMQPTQTRLPMNSYSSTGTLTFWVWRKEVLATLGCSG